MSMQMKRYLLFIPLLLLALAAASCGLNVSPGGPTQIYITPTSYSLFSGGDETIPSPLSSFQATAIPTVSGFFDPENATVKQPTQPAPTQNTSPYEIPSQSISVTDTRVVSIFDNDLNPNWQVLSSDRSEFDLENEENVYAGLKSIKVTPHAGFGTVYFSVRSDTSETYARDRVLGLEFKINGGKNPIQPGDLGITILGSNEYNYFVSGDNSVKGTLDPIFSETRLYDLGVNQTIPPNTWVVVTVWLNNLTYDPAYKNVTAFYIKNDENFLVPYYLDDVHLIMVSNQVAQSTPDPSTDTPGTAVLPNSNLVNEVVQVDVDPQKNVHPISPMVYGVSTLSRDTLVDLKPGLNNWGGNISTRFNWELGNASNTGSEGRYKNTDLGLPANTSVDQVLAYSRYFNAGTRVTLPTLGWVAKNSNPNTCSFPLPDGSCGDGDHSTCIDPKEVADPRLANIDSRVDSVVQWVKRLTLNSNVTIFAMDNEPDQWGITHYDVHPKCTTYQEMLQKYLEYAVPVREAAPNALLAGPVVSGWDHYWNSPAGKTDKQANGNQDFIPWFLDQLKQHDTETGIPSIDVLDVHYFPEGLNNQNIDVETATRRNQAPRALWDESYIDQASSIADPVNLIPRLRYVIGENYPGLRLGISAWNFGADQNINGAIAIADALGIFGRDDLFYASYSSAPDRSSPGAFAFKMYTNYDASGSKFGGTSVMATSDKPDLATVYASVDPVTQQIHLMVINKHPSSTVQVKFNIANLAAPRRTLLYRYSRETVDKIITVNTTWPEDGVIEIPPYSINHFILTP